MSQSAKRIVSAVCGTPWAIQPEKLEAIAEFLTLRASGIRFTKAELRDRIGAAAPARNAAPPRGIAVLSLFGVISQRAGMMTEFSGGTSTDRFGSAFDQAMADEAVTAILVDVDSPGGNVEGVPELFDKIFQSRGKKPVVAVANSLAASAAYWIACACDEIVVTPSGNVGSIGVITVHLDSSEADAKDGLAYTVVSAGDYKAEGVYAPLSKDAKAALQDRVNTYYGMFVRAVAKARGISVEDVRGGYGQGRVVSASAALKAGMVDRIATLDETLARLGGRRGAQAIKMAAALAPDLGIAASDDLLDLLDPLPLPMAASAATAIAGSAGVLEDAPPIRIPLALEPPAPVAKEIPMTASAAAAPTGGADPKDDLLKMQAELARRDALAALATEHPEYRDQIDGWVKTGASFEAAATAIRKDLSDILAGKPPINTTLARVRPDNESERPFATLGEQLVAVVQAGLPGRRIDPRLKFTNGKAMQAAASGMNESIGPEGGFFIAPELLPGVLEPIYATDPILSRVTRIPISGNAIKYNVVDETSRSTGARYGGIQAYWAAEADTATAKKPKLRQMELALKKLIGIGYLTDELMQDAPAAQTLLTNAFSNEVQFMLADAIFRGSGAGMPLGFLNSGAVVSQTIEATQTIANSNQFIAYNIAKMLARIPASLWGDLIWLYNQELLPKLVTATVSGTAGAVPVFINQGGYTQKPFDMILGRAAYASELCEAEGTPGDLIAIAPSQYHLGEKGGIAAATSLHVRFLYDENTLRITYRVDGQPLWTTSVIRYKGANPLSPFVQLAVRV